jgi:hypothetical protein
VFSAILFSRQLKENSSNKNNYKNTNKNNNKNSKHNIDKHNEKHTENLNGKDIIIQESIIQYPLFAPTIKKIILNIKKK